MIAACGLDLDTHGAALHDGAARSRLAAIEDAVRDTPAGRAGVRLTACPALSALLAEGPIGTIVARYRGECSRPVRAILFDKTPATNWALGWHQDRTIVVRDRHDVRGFGPWTTKAGLQHVEPPFSVIAAMVTLRIHLDDVPVDNAPLLVAPGSHRLGRIAEAAIPAAVARHGEYACLARRGDVWAYATPILHASAAATGARHRRVLPRLVTRGGCA